MNSGAFAQATTRPPESGWAPTVAALVPGLTVLAHADLGRIGERVALAGLDRDRRVEVSRLGPLFVAPRADSRRPLADVHLSRQPLLLGPGSSPGSVMIDPGSTRMSVELDGRRLTEPRDVSAEEMDRGVVLLLAQRVALLLHHLDPVISNEASRLGLIGESHVMSRLRGEIHRVADLDVPVLLRGETGSGKELVARAIHQASRRRGRPMVAVNMAAVPPTLAAAELFGAERGAFTGADKRRDGHFGRAHKGTLFLDEVGATPTDVQALLLRCLETGEVQAVGADRPRSVDVRVIAATDADLESAVVAERFAAPLLYRLSTYELSVPPLRNRRDDLGRLFVHFLRQELAASGERHRMDPPRHGEPSWLPAGLLARLAGYDWPGNVRELRNVVRQLVISNRGATQLAIHPALERRLIEGEGRGEVHLDSRDGSAKTSRAETDSVMPARRAPAEVREAELIDALRAHRWRPSAAADSLGIARASIYDLIEKSPNVRKASELDRDEIDTAREHCDGHLECMADTLEVSEAALKRRMHQLEM
ncbi:MAG: sigma-54 dependent transcriptional regulator [Acidobacteriota bacterium]